MKKRIGVLIGQIVQIGGVAIAAFEEVRALREIGYDAELLVLYEKKGFRYEDFAKGIPIRWLSREYPGIYRVNFKIPFFSFFSLFHLLGGPAASGILKKGEYDILICHETYNCFAGLTLKKRLDIPCIAYIWDPITYILPRVYKKRALGIGLPVLRFPARYLDRRIVLDSSRTLACSKVHVDLLSRLSKDEGRLDVLYPGCFLTESLPSERKSFILALTKWDIGKNPFFLLDVLESLQDKDIELIVAGNWVQQRLKKAFTGEIKKRGLGKRVKLMGRVSAQKKEELFSGAKLLVHPIFEAFGMMCLEGAAYGCPFLIPKGSGVTELFSEKDYISFPEDGDVEGFASCIDNFLDDEEVFNKKSELVRSVAKRYSWQEHGRNLARIIESV